MLALFFIPFGVTAPEGLFFYLYLFVPLVVDK